MPLVNCPFLKPVYFKPLFSMWLWFSPNEEGGEGGERELIYCPPCFCRVCGTAGIWTPECGIQFNSQPFSFCYLWKIISHLQYFFVSLFLKLQNIKQEVSDVFLACSRHQGGSLSKLSLLLKDVSIKYITINYDSRTAEQCKCEVSIGHFKLILFSLLSLFFLVFSFLSVIFGLSEKRTFLA